MNSRSRPGQDPGLFDDLPLQQGPSSRKTPPEADRASSPEAPEASPAAEPEPLPLFSDEDPDQEALEETTRPAWYPGVSLKTRLTAGLFDFGIILAVMLAIWLGLWALGIDIDLVGRALVVVFLIPFSFLYQIFPLAFWGCTPGMARAGIVARNADGQALSFSQAALRWLASVLTVLTFGVPLLLTATSGRSLADRLSGSQTVSAR